MKSRNNFYSLHPICLSIPTFLSNIVVTLKTQSKTGPHFYVP